MPQIPRALKVSPEQSQLSTVNQRPCVRGKFIFAGEEKLYIRGVTYGPFRPDDQGHHYGDPQIVTHDFAHMVANGLNAVRTYTVPPRWFLDLAYEYGLYVMVGLPWEQHVTFLNDAKASRSIESRVRAAVRGCAGHPAILCYVIGNEIPAPIVRWHGRRRVARFLKRLYTAVKAEDAGALVTYVNYPSTEYLQLPFIDFVCFNVYLEMEEAFEAYLGRLQNIAGDRPLLLAELGLDSRRNGLAAQAQALDWQLRAAFAAGCAGAFVFSWTDEWFRGGYDIEDWDFGLTDRARRPKPALESIRRAFADVPFPKELRWPRISVIVCSCNGARTIRECLEGLSRINYPDFEVIVVDDGSSDSTAAICREYSVQLISTRNYGLSSARNTGLKAATGEIVAYIDDDAYPDPDWLTYLAAGFVTTTHGGIGGPNIPPAGDNLISHCVANSPGGPTHVLLSDREAEHIPGCNMAFRRDCLDAIGGFDPQFRAAGDDVDVCWRLREGGWTLGFSPAAVVWHHRRNSVRAYLKQQKGYGRAEALLEKKWPEKYNTVGHLTWAGRVYANGNAKVYGWRRNLVYHGTWGTALFQSVYEPARGTLWSLPLMPEWYLVILVLTVLILLGLVWTPLLIGLPLLALCIAAPIVDALMSAARSPRKHSAHHMNRLMMLALTALLHVAQPLARLWGRVRNGLTPWRKFGENNLALPMPRTFTIWSEKWQAPDERLKWIESAARARRALVIRGGNFDHWDLEVRGGILSGARLRMAVEEHGAGRQFVKFRLWPRFSPTSVLSILFTLISSLAAMDRSWIVCTVSGIVAVALIIRTLQECAAATGTFLGTLMTISDTEKSGQALSQQLPVEPISAASPNGNGHGKHPLDPATMLADRAAASETSRGNGQLKEKVGAKLARSAHG